jgi:hypothetical protein
LAGWSDCWSVAVTNIRERQERLTSAAAAAAALLVVVTTTTFACHCILLYLCVYICIIFSSVHNVVYPIQQNVVWYSTCNRVFLRIERIVLLDFIHRLVSQKIEE